METTLASNTGDTLLTPQELQEMQANVTIKVHTFKGMSQEQRVAKFAQVKPMWDQFTEVCQGEVDSSHIARFSAAVQGTGSAELSCDHIVIISCKKYVLGYALVAEETIVYDDPTRNLLTQSPYSGTFDTDKTFHIKLLCSRPNSGIGTQLVRVCENLAIQFRCASVRLEAVPTAHGFYKSVGLVPFLEAKFVCSPEYIHNDARKFEDAIVAMAQSFESSEGGAGAGQLLSPAKLQGKYNSYMNKASEARRAVLSGVLKSRIVAPIRVHQWATQKTKLDRELKHIVDTVFTTNNVHSETILMTKCLLKKSAGDESGGSGHDSDSDSCHSGETVIDPNCAVQANSAQGSGSSGSDSPEYLKTVHPDEV